MKPFRLIPTIIFLTFLSHQIAAQSDTCYFKLQLVHGTDQLPLEWAFATYQEIKSSELQLPQYLATTDRNGQATLMYSGHPLRITITYLNSKTEIELYEIPCEGIITRSVEIPQQPAKDVVVTGFLNAKKLSLVPAEIGLIRSSNFNATDQTSLQNAVNTIPGVIMESRGYGGSHRLSIRGSALRAPFAVRNIKMYLAGIPLTSPDGQTPLEMVDASDIGTLEIIKGPAGSIYGSGNGGVLLINPKLAYTGRLRVGTNFQAGSYDLYRMNTFVEAGFSKSALRVSHVWQDNQGYREQEFNRKNQLSLVYTKYMRTKDKLLFYGTYYYGNWGLPGALSADQEKEDPKQANLFSKNINASVARRRLMAGISHTWSPVSRITANTSAYYYSTHKLNPYGTSAFNSGYKDEGADGFGGRTVWSANFNLEKYSVLLNAGGEWQSEKYNILESTILNGEPADFRYLYDIGYIAGMAFGQVNLNYTRVFFIDAGLSYNSNSQQVKGLTSSSFVFDTTATWSSQILPRIAISLQLPGSVFLYHSVSHGDANPTVFEMVDYESNRYNLSLRPERGISREWGIRQNSSTSPFSFSVNYYDFELTDMIVPYAIQGPDDDAINVYKNAASADQRGLEWMIAIQPVTIMRGLYAAWQTAGSIFEYSFADFNVDGKILNDKEIPGVPKANVSSSLQLQIGEKITMDVMHYWFDRMPLDNENKLYTSSYHLLNLSASTYFKAGNRYEIRIQAGANNITGSNYSSFLALNATNGRYFNPMPGINYFVGLGLVYAKN